MPCCDARFNRSEIGKLIGLRYLITKRVGHRHTASDQNPSFNRRQGQVLSFFDVALAEPFGLCRVRRAD